MNNVPIKEQLGVKTAPVLKLNIYNAHRVDDSVKNQAIIITDLNVAAQVAYQDRKSNSHEKPVAEAAATINTNNMTTRSARLLRNVTIKPDIEMK